MANNSMLSHCCLMKYIGGASFAANNIKTEEYKQDLYYLMLKQLEKRKNSSRRDS